jgi:hypothetical protein
MAPPSPLTDADQLARLRVAVVTGHLSQDLGRWVLARLTPAPERRAVRNAHLLEATRYLPPGGPWRKARALEAALRGPTTSYAINWHVRAAHASHPVCPTSHRQLLRVLMGRYPPRKTSGAAPTSSRRR